MPPRRLRHASDAEFERIRLRIRLALGALALVTVVGVLGFVLIGRGEHGIVDAIYMTVITLSTVGFGEIIDMAANPAARLFTIALILGGMGVVAYTVPMLAAFMIEGHLNDIFGRRRMEKTIAKMTGHFVVCGEAAQAWHVAQELLRTDRGVVLVVPSEAVLAQVEDWVGEAIPHVLGDATHEPVLASAGIERATGAVFAMDNDKDNVLGVLAARRLAPRARLIAATERPDTEAKLRAVGADAVVSPSRIGGLRMASELVRPHVVTFLDQMLRQNGGSLRVEEAVVGADADGRNHTVGALAVDELPNVLLLAVRDGETGRFTFKPDPGTPLRRGMAIVVMTDADGRQALEQRVRALTGSAPA